MLDSTSYSLRVSRAFVLMRVWFRTVFRLSRRLRTAQIVVSHVGP